MGASPGSLAKEVRSALIKGMQRTFDPEISAEHVRVQPTEYKDYLSVQVVSPRFEARDPDERSEAVFAALDAEKVSKQIQNKITMVLTFTPDEHREYLIIESGPSIDQIRRAIQRFARQHKKDVVIGDIPQKAGQFRLCSVIGHEGRTAELDYWDLGFRRTGSLSMHSITAMMVECVERTLGIPVSRLSPAPRFRSIVQPCPQRVSFHASAHRPEVLVRLNRERP